MDESDTEISIKNHVILIIQSEQENNPSKDRLSENWNRTGQEIYLYLICHPRLQNKVLSIFEGRFDASPYIPM